MGPSTRQYNWRPRQRRFHANRVQLEYAFSHPLQKSMAEGKRSGNHSASGLSTPVSTDDKSIASVISRNGNTTVPKSASRASTAMSIGSDPLTAALEGSDPLSMFAAAAEAGDDDPLFKPTEPKKKGPATVVRGAQGGAQKGSLQAAKEAVNLEGLEPWFARKNGILAKYTTSEKLSIVTSFLTGGEKVIVTTTDKVKTRLEQLDDFEEGSVREMLGLTQQDYVSRIQQLNSELSLAWSTDQRVKSLKIAIQCAKLLTTADVLNFYPSKFVLVTDLLDNFGNLVFNRLRTKEMETSQVRGISNYGVAGADETARNWFYKIASIRELVPRFYLETAILKSLKFFTHGDQECKEALVRLAHMTRGMGNPLVAAYARCYLAKVATEVVGYTGEKKFILSCIDDTLDTIPRMYSPETRNEVSAQKMDFPSYLTLYTPALDYMLECAALKAPDTLFMQLLTKCRKHEANGAVFLNSLLTAFKPDFIAANALEIVELLNCQGNSNFPRHVLYRSLGLCLVVATPDPAIHMQLVNQVWKGVATLPTIENYVTCAEVWIQFILKHFSKKEINTFLGDIVKHVGAEKDRSAIYSSLLSIVDKILLYITDFAVLFGLDKFLPLLDVFEKESAKVEACKMILETYIKHQVGPSSNADYEPATISDPFLIGALMNICRTIHNSLNALTVADEKRQIGLLVNGFIQTVSYGRDFEALLNFYVDARAAFTSIDAVMAYLVQKVNGLTMITLDIMTGAHSKKTASFVRACIAFSFITIPSMSSVLTRLELYLVTGRVALINHCWGQAEACFQAILSDVAQVPQSVDVDGRKQQMDNWLEQYVANLLSALLVVPDPPEQEPLSLLENLLIILQSRQWDRNGEAYFKILLGTLQLLATATQDHYPYHVDGVDSNDALYGGHGTFLNKVNDIASRILEDLLLMLRELGDMKLHQRQASCALMLFDVIVNFSDLDEASLLKLGVNLWNLIQKQSGSVSQKSLAKRLEALKARAGCGGDAAASANKVMPYLQLRTSV